MPYHHATTLMPSIPPSPKPLTLLALGLTSAVVLALAACGGGPADAPVASAPTAVVAAAPVMLPASFFTVDDLVTAGWKKSKQFDASSLPAAVEVWYGFYDKRDIEARFYATHADATGPGAQSAEEAVDRSPNSNIGGGIITTGGNRVQYHAYAVVGNVVMLCQQDVEVCLRLIEKLPAK